MEKRGKEGQKSTRGQELRVKARTGKASRAGASDGKEGELRPMVYV